MTIDENREIFDLSDHNLLVANFNVNTHGDRHFSKKRKQISYLKKKDKTKEQFLMEIKNNIDKKTSFYCSIRDLIKLLMFVYKCGIQPIVLE